MLAETVTAFIEFSNQYYATSLTKEAFTQWSWADCLNLPQAEIQLRLESFTDSACYNEIKPVVGAVAGVRALFQRHTLVAVTSRWGNQVPKTRPWLDLNFPGIFSQIHFSHNPIPGAVSYGLQSKTEICCELGAAVIIDDSLVFANECASKNIKVIVLDYPWNRGVVSENVVRALSWQAIPEIVNSIYGR